MFIETHGKKYSVVKKAFSSKKNIIYICKEAGSGGQSLFTLNVIKDDRLISRYLPVFAALKNSSCNSDLVDLFSKDSVLYAVFRYYSPKAYCPLQYNDCTGIREKTELAKRLLLYLQSSNIPPELLVMILENNSILLNNSSNFHLNYFLKFDSLQNEPRTASVIQMTGTILKENLFFGTHTPQISGILEKCESGQYLSFEEICSELDQFLGNLDMNPENIGKQTKRMHRSIRNYLKIRNTFVLKRFTVLAAVLLLLLGFLTFTFILPFVLNKFFYHEFYVNTKPLESFSGKAKVLYGNSKLQYEGELLEGKFNGFGKLYGRNQQLVYSGGFKLNSYDGNGELYENNRLKYKGDFLLNKYSGKGQVYYDNGVLSYEGDFKDGAYEGSGSLYYPGGKLEYRGDFKGGQFSGSGTFYSQKGKVMYKGNFKFGRYDGQGILYDSAGSKKYEGLFADGLFEGAGTEYDKSGAVVYKGSFGQGLYNGQGVLFSTGKNCPLYEGNFLCGKYNGTGKLYDTNAESLVYEGDFNDNLFHGTGTLYGKNSRKLYTGSFIRGNPDYFSVLGMPAEEIKNTFLSIPQTITGVDSICNTYEELGVTLVLSPVPAEPAATAVPDSPKAADATVSPSSSKTAPAVAGTEPVTPKAESTPPSVSKVILWKDYAISGITSTMNAAQMAKVLGEPLYEYTSPILFEDQTALNNRRQSGYGPDKIPSDIYMVSFDIDGYELTAAFRDKKDKPLYAVLSKRSIVYGMG
ncbi:MAG TPA: hypothetical protein VHP38_14170 [Ruminiclostridium sp.]|nr:hypothetical protein [Ruminiclostridium sp.]